ncbi:MAG: lipid-A-disaccharide synthase [Planctomycetota bacterium]
MRIFFSVGEPSGDLHASNLIRRLRQQVPEMECVGLGGPKMAAAGCELVRDLTTLAVMGFSQVVVHLREFFRILAEAEAYLDAHPVDAVVLVDFPGFNWHLARKAKQLGIPVSYYGVPQLWAWAPWRVRKLRRLVDLAICKLPFEPEWFARRGCQAEYVGHPFFDQLSSQTYDESFVAEQSEGAGPLLLLLPGSRNQEVKTHWPMLRSAAEQCLREHPNLRVAVGCYRQSQFEQIDRELRAEGSAITAHWNRTPELMRAADVCLACSGSVSLELMYHRLPTIIVYRVSRLMNFFKNLFLRCRYITLVNLMASDSIERTKWQTYWPDAVGSSDVPMPEYLTRRDCSQELARRASDLIARPQERERRRTWLGKLKEQFAIPGASERAAELILQRLGRKAAQRRAA